MRKIFGIVLVSVILMMNHASPVFSQKAQQKITLNEAESLIIESEFIYSTGKGAVAIDIAKNLGDRIYESSDPAVKKAYLPRTLFLIGAYYFEIKDDAVVAHNYYDDVLRYNPEFAGDPTIYSPRVLEHFVKYCEEKKAFESARIKEKEIKDKEAKVQEAREKELIDKGAKAISVQPSVSPLTDNLPVRARVIKRDANLRLEPDEKSEVITTVPLGAEFVIVETKGDWVKVELPDQKQGFKIFGYLHKADIKLI